MCGRPDCDQETFYTKLGDNDYTDLKVEFIVQDTVEGVDYLEPYTDDVSVLY